MFKFINVIVALIVFGTLVFAGTEEDLTTLNTKVENILEMCKSTTEVTEDHLRSMISGKTPLQGKTGCFLYCIAREIGMVKANNMFDQDQMYKFMDPFIANLKERKMDAVVNDVKKIVDSCFSAQQGGDDSCVAAKNVGECVSSSMKTAGFFSS